MHATDGAAVAAAVAAGNNVDEQGLHSRASDCARMPSFIAFQGAIWQATQWCSACCQRSRCDVAEAQVHSVRL